MFLLACLLLFLMGVFFIRLPDQVRECFWSVFIFSCFCFAGMVRQAAGEKGSAIELEVWSEKSKREIQLISPPFFLSCYQVWKLSTEAFGSFVSSVAPPLSIGNIELESGEIVKGKLSCLFVLFLNFGRGYPGFLCEQYILPKSKNISQFGGWRNYVARGKQ